MKYMNRTNLFDNLGIYGNAILKWILTFKGLKWCKVLFYPMFSKSRKSNVCGRFPGFEYLFFW